jgi:Reverse transcriptase (RNA-dependent DNA polymerase)
MEDVRRILLHSPPTTCALDPLPTFVLRNTVDILLPLIHVMCNATLKESHLPSSKKAAIVTLILKKANADPDEVKNYRPISNLTFISKVVERNIAEHITRQLNESNLMPPLQSSYRCKHSTETAVMKVLSDILDATGARKVILPGLLDLSVTFHTVDHSILLLRPQASFEMDGLALGWIRSFLADRTQAVAFRRATTNYTTLQYGVPQGSVHGPLLFLLYAADVGAVPQKHDVSAHSSYDDTQLYASCPAIDASTLAARLLRCIEDMH